MEVEYWYLTGHPSDIRENLKRALGQYRRRATQHKVGATSDPETRVKAHRQGAWSRMIVVYETTSLRYAAELEHDLIEQGWNNSEGSANDVGGGGGLKAGYEKYYVYVLLRY